VVHAAAAEELKKAGGNEDPYLKFKGKTIQVTGKVQVVKEAAKLHVDKASQIVLLEEKKPEDKKPEEKKPAEKK
jgi:DNA/RNA endonuclease YhcR with UshA esterase domain